MPPRIAPFAFLTDLHVSDRVGIQCFITKGDLPLDIKWRKDGGSLDSDVSVQHYGHYTSSLSIESLSPRHAGSYTCVASNPAATATHTSDLLVNGITTALPLSLSLCYSSSENRTFLVRRPRRRSSNSSTVRHPDG